jgi:hypothetical protein
MEYVIRFEDGSYLGIHEISGMPFAAKRLRDAAIYSYDELKASRLYLWKYIGQTSEFRFCGLGKYIEEGWPDD